MGSPSLCWEEAGVPQDRCELLLGEKYSGNIELLAKGVTALINHARAKRVRQELAFKRQAWINDSVFLIFLLDHIKVL